MQLLTADPGTAPVKEKNSLARNFLKFWTVLPSSVTVLPSSVTKRLFVSTASIEGLQAATISARVVPSSGIAQAMLIIGKNSPVSAGTSHDRVTGALL